MLILILEFVMNGGCVSGWLPELLLQDMAQNVPFTVMLALERPVMTIAGTALIAEVFFS